MTFKTLFLQNHASKFGILGRKFNEILFEFQSCLFPVTRGLITLAWALWKDWRRCFLTYLLTDLSMDSFLAALVICFWSSNSSVRLDKASSV